MNSRPKKTGPAERRLLSLTLDGVDYTIVGVTAFGVTALGFRLEDDADVYTPLGQSDPLILNDRAAHNGIYSLARLAPGVNLAQAQAEISTIQNGLDHLYPDANRDLGIYIEPLKQFVVGDAGKMLLLLFGAVGFVLLIACANVANLLLARSAGRRTGVCCSLGAWSESHAFGAAAAYGKCASFSAGCWSGTPNCYVGSEIGTGDCLGELAA